MVTVRVDVTKEQNICIGRVGENNHTQVVFDISSWMTEYPSATIGLFCCLPGQCEAYPVVNTVHDGNTFTWTVSNEDVSSPGRGKCEIVCIDNGTVAKSMIFGTLILEALGGCSPIPQPWAYWQVRFIQLKNEAEQAVYDAQQAVSAAATAHQDAASAAASASSASIDAETASSAATRAENAADTITSATVQETLAYLGIE